MRGHGAFVAVCLPPELEQPIAAEYLSGVSSEEGEQLELSGGHRNRRAIYANFMCWNIDKQASEAQHAVLETGSLLPCGAVPAQYGVDAGHDLVGRRRLHHIVIGAQAQASDLVVVGISCRE